MDIQITYSPTTSLETQHYIRKLYLVYGNDIYGTDDLPDESGLVRDVHATHALTGRRVNKLRGKVINVRATVDDAYGHISVKIDHPNVQGYVLEYSTTNLQ